MTQINAAPTAVPIEPLLASRWSPRAFNPTRPVAHDTLRSLFEAARWAPSCFNQQPWRYLVCDKFADSDAWNLACNALVYGNQCWAKNAPVLVVAVSDRQSKLSNGDDNRWADYDTGAASENFCLQATAMGLAAHQMGGFDVTELHTSFGIPDRFNPIAVIALGYGGDANNLKNWQRAAEVAPRTRRPLSDVVHEGHWEKPFFRTDS